MVGSDDIPQGGPRVQLHRWAQPAAVDSDHTASASHSKNSTHLPGTRDDNRQRAGAVQVLSLPMSGTF